MNIDAEPTNPNMIWDVISLTSGFQERNVSWRGSGTTDNNQFNPKIFTLSAGTHQLIIRGREPNVQLDRISIVPYGTEPNVPGDLNGDGLVNSADFFIVVSDFGKASGFNNAKSDSNADNIVDIYDVVYIASRIP